MDQITIDYIKRNLDSIAKVVEKKCNDESAKEAILQSIWKFKAEVSDAPVRNHAPSTTVPSPGG